MATSAGAAGAAPSWTAVDLPAVEAGPGGAFVSSPAVSCASSARVRGGGIVRTRGSELVLPWRRCGSHERHVDCGYVDGTDAPCSGWGIRRVSLGRVVPLHFGLCGGRAICAAGGWRPALGRNVDRRDMDGTRSVVAAAGLLHVVVAGTAAGRGVVCVGRLVRGGRGLPGSPWDVVGLLLPLFSSRRDVGGHRMDSPHGTQPGGWFRSHRCPACRARRPAPAWRSAMWPLPAGRARWP